MVYNYFYTLWILFGNILLRIFVFNMWYLFAYDFLFLVLCKLSVSG